MKWLLFLSSFYLTNAMAYEYKCEYDILARGAFISLDLKRTLTIAEGESLAASLPHTIHQVFYQGENGEYFRYLILDEVGALNLSKNVDIKKNVRLGKLQLTLRRKAPEEVYLSFRLEDENGTNVYEPDAIVSEEHYFEVHTSKNEENPIVRVNCYYQ